MKLIIGGAFQGKREAVCKIYGLKTEEILSGAETSEEELFAGKAVNDFHLLVKRLLREQRNPAELTRRLISQKPDLIVITDEIGYGIVPVDAFERNWREQTGRCCCALAEASDEVVRVLAGNPVWIKGERK